MLLIFISRIINFCVSSAMGLLIYSIMLVMEYEDKIMCAFRGFVTYFFLLATFLWSNCLAFRILQKIRQTTLSDIGRKSFIWYALYAWGSSAILTIIGIILNYTPGRH